MYFGSDKVGVWREAGSGLGKGWGLRTGGWEARDARVQYD